MTDTVRKARASIEQLRRIAPRARAWTSLLRECADEIEAALALPAEPELREALRACLTQYDAMGSIQTNTLNEARAALARDEKG
jgi:hypothetical protein